MMNLLKCTAWSLVMSGALVTTAQQVPDFNAEDAAGIYSYDVEKVIKKLKVDDESAKQLVYEAIGEYNLKMYELSDAHAATLSELDAYFDQQVKVAMQKRDRSQMDGVKTKIREVIPPIRKEVMAHEQALNTSLASVLCEKQNKRWLSYQKSQRPATPLPGG